MVLEHGIPVPVGSEEDLKHICLGHKRSGGGEGLGRRRIPITSDIVSSAPLAFIYHNFLSKKECEYLIKLATPHMAKSLVSDNETGKGIESKARTSYGMFLKRGQDKVIRGIEKRIADYTLIPVENGESLYVLHYEKGQKYDPHYDYSDGGSTTRNGGPRMATFLMYLSDVEEGGETVFPSAKGNIEKKGISIKPKMGDALLFWSMNHDGTLDPLSLHGSSPVIKGDKWSCTKWMHVDEHKIGKTKGV
ncbi:probable prolyl 4-hydroxylase 3 [Salvia splendens]|uniref:probable prolyl 4-hydroxylase 3 n=1 Tax=Salvia splendens TaxID=180675 RepID=UPI001C256A47|nr:probable prolyl 4-hydroxylase 3 [Salvia splendens]